MDTGKDCSLASCCGRCFRPVQPSVGGFVVSCGCFMCFTCAKTSSADRVATCLVCGKQNIQALSLSDADMPEDVLAKVADPLLSIDKVRSTLNEHIQYYKQTMQKMRTRIQQLNRENIQLKEMLRGEPNRQRQPVQPFQNSSQSQQRPQTSLSSVLSNPINPATLPPSAGSVLGKRPDTNQSQQPQQRTIQSGHFRTPLVGASNAAEPPAKRAQTAQPLRPGTSVPSGGQRVEVSRVTPCDPLQFHQESRHQQNQQSEYFRQTNQRPQTQQGLGPQSQQGQKSLYAVSPPRQLTTPSSTPSSEEHLWGFRGTESASPSLSHTVTPRGQESDRDHDNRGSNKDDRDIWGEGRESYRDSRERMPPPVMDRPPSNPSANRSPMFETPSRLRSPHTVVPRVGSSGGGSGGSGYRPGSGLSSGGGLNSNRPGSGAGTGVNSVKNHLGHRLGSAGKQPGPANPFQGVGVTMSQHQVPPAYGAGRGGLA